MAKHLSKRSWAAVGGVGVLLLALFVYLPIGTVTLEVGPETTVLTGPLCPDGTVDYMSILDAEAAVGVAPSNNAAVVFLMHIPREGPAGERFLASDRWGEIVSRLGLRRDDIEPCVRFVPWHARKVRSCCDRLLEDIETSVCEGHSREPGAEDACMRSVGSGPHVLPRDPAGDQECCAATVDQADELQHLWDLLVRGEVHPDLRPWIDENADAMHHWRVGSYQERLYLPLVGPPAAEHYAAFFMVARQVADHLSLRALLQMHEGNMVAAWEDVLTMHRLARLLDQTPVLLQQLCALTVEGRACHTGYILASQGVYQPGELQPWLAQLVALRDVGQVAATVRAEHLLLLDDIMIAYRSDGLQHAHLGVRTGASTDWNSLLRQVNMHWKEVYAGAELIEQGSLDALRSNWEQWFYGLEPDDDRIRLTWAGGRLARGAYGRVLADRMMIHKVPNLMGFGRLYWRAQDERHTMLVATAMAAYHADHGCMPQSLHELVPAYLPDTFTSVLGEAESIGWQ